MPDDPRQKHLLDQLDKMHAPFPLIAADIQGIPRADVHRWLKDETCHFTQSWTRLRAAWVGKTLGTIMNMNTSPKQADRLKWLLVRVDPEVFSEAKAAPRAKDNRHVPPPAVPRQLDLSKLGEIEP